MGMERNADAVPIECYAPLLANVNPADPAKGYPKGWQWPTNLMFLILWHATDGDHYNWWNIGGWGNTYTGFQTAEAGGRESFGPEANFTVEKDRWYDMRLKVAGNHVRGFIDNKLVNEATLEPHVTQAATLATAAYVRADRCVVLKVINAGKEPVDAAIRQHGVGPVEPRGKAIVLAGDPRAVNTVEQPANVAPKEADIDVASSFRRTFPPHSLTVLRLTAQPQ